MHPPNHNAPPDRPINGSIAAELNGRPAPHGPEAAPAAGRPLVLLVDDSPIERAAMGRLLALQGYATRGAGNGAEAIEQMKTVRVDAVLLDLQMPGTDGFTVLDYVQEHRRAMPVVLLSGMPLDQIQHRMRSMTTPELPPLFVKPVDPDQILAVLDMLLEGTLPARFSDAGEA